MCQKRKEGEGALSIIFRHSQNDVGAFPAIEGLRCWVLGPPGHAQR